MRYAIIMSPENHALFVAGKLTEVKGEDFGAGVELMVSKFCPTWGPEPKWWRRWFLREKRQRVIYRMDKTPLGGNMFSWLR